MFGALKPGFRSLAQTCSECCRRILNRTAAASRGFLVIKSTAVEKFGLRISSGYENSDETLLMDYFLGCSVVICILEALNLSS